MILAVVLAVQRARRRLQAVCHGRAVAKSAEVLKQTLHILSVYFYLLHEPLYTGALASQLNKPRSLFIVFSNLSDLYWQVEERVTCLPFYKQTLFLKFQHGRVRKQYLLLRFGGQSRLLTSF